MSDSKTIIHYCCGSYYKGNYGGVARYDYHISLAFPNYKHFTGPKQKNEMLEYLKKVKNPLVITDNHLACDIPNEYNILLVHHGVAQTHAEREPGWCKYWKELCCNGQSKMLFYRNPKSTRIVSISQFCTDEFIKYYGDTYLRFERKPILHTSELDETKYKIIWNKTPIVLGNWQGINKGEPIVNNISKNSKFFKFNKLNCKCDNGNITEYNKRKQQIYLNSDIFLQISTSEGNSYASLDALICGIPVVASDVGLFYKDMPEDCFVKIDWKRNGDEKYIEEKLKYAWENRVELGRKGREWYMKNCRIVDWKKKMQALV